MQPRISPDGKRLAFTRAADGISVTASDETIAVGKPTPLFKVLADGGGWGSNWGATGDLEKFVVVEAPHASGQRFELLTNWAPGR